MRRRAILNASSVGGSELEFPIYLKSIQGSGKNRDVLASNVTKALVDFFNINKGFINDSITLEYNFDDNHLLYIDEIRVYYMSQMDGNSGIDIVADSGYYGYIYSDTSLGITND